MRVCYSLGYLFKHLVSESSQGISYIWHLFLHYLFQKWGQLTQGCVVHVIEPGLDEDSVVWLKLEVLSHVIDNDSLAQVSSDSGQVLYKDRTVWQSMLSVESVLDSLFLVYLVEDPIGVLKEES